MPLSPALAHTRSLASGVRPVGVSIAGSLLLAVAAHVAVPFWPVPLTLQSLVVMALGAALGPVAGAAAVLAWIAEGLAGLPVFAGGIGPATLLGPTGGYMLGYVAAALIAGLAARRGWLASGPSAVLSFLVADAAVFVPGVAWLAVLIGWTHAVAGGLVPFLLGEALKIGLLTAGASLLANRLGRRG